MKPPRVCSKCGWPPVKVNDGTRLDKSGLCWYCRRALSVGIKPRKKG